MATLLTEIQHFISQETKCISLQQNHALLAQRLTLFYFWIQAIPTCSILNVSYIASQASVLMCGKQMTAGGIGSKPLLKLTLNEHYQIPFHALKKKKILLLKTWPINNHGIHQLDCQGFMLFLGSLQ